MPALSPTMTEGTITAWKKKEGDSVAVGDVLLEIETDKAGMDVEASEDGILAKILAIDPHPDGAKVPVNELIALMVEEGDDLTKVEIPKSQAAPPKEVKKEAPAPSTKKEQSTSSHQTASTPSSNLISPAVGHLMLANHINDVTTIPSTGPKGRVLKGDVLAFLGKIKARPAPEPTIPQPKTLPPPSKPAPTSAPAPSAPQASGSAFTDIPTSNMRKVIASRLGESKTNAPHSYVTRDIVIDNMMKLRQVLSEELQVKVSVNDFLIKASSLALRDVPESNVQFVAGSDNIKQNKDIDISVAVATPTGLITPIVKGADARGLQSISLVVKELAEKAKKNKLKPEEYQGGSFSISNLGMFGVTNFTAIINSPQAAILAVGGSRTILKPSAVQEVDPVTDSEVFEFLGGAKKSASSGTKSVKKANADLDLIDFLGGGAPLKKKSSSKSESALGDEILNRLRPTLERSQVIGVTLSIDERVIDREVAGKFLERLSHYVENPETILL
ncbi:pyruvate dehydrogenase complex dihydrolipoamide acetyltransferase component (E2) [Entomortierella beljakovae]|nr:pyruvate dehydrogenase complex dihydrolipoamide acetyltransferase component (E2) [Entomortierella beljakovae]